MRTGDKEDSSNTSSSSWRSHGVGDCPFQPAQASPAQVNHGSSSPHPHAHPEKKTSLAAPSLQGATTDHHQGPSLAFPLPGQAKPPHSTSPHTLQDGLSSPVRRGAKQGTVFGCGLTSMTKTHWSHSYSCCPQHGPVFASTGEPCSWLRLPVCRMAKTFPTGILLPTAGYRWPGSLRSPVHPHSRNLRPCSSPTTMAPFSATVNCDSEEESRSEVFLLCQLSNAQEEPLAAPHQELEIGLFYNHCLKVTCIYFVQFKAFCPAFMYITLFSIFISVALVLTINRR